tara:strand:- start:534 stop:1187 length:654 start_codon:yes stop_codon:yes gene_type:complete
MKHKSILNLTSIEQAIKKNFKIQKFPTIIAVSKTFDMEKINPLIEYGHKHFGENKVQEAIDKWSSLKAKRSDINLHLIGKLQTNKVKKALGLFDYIHSVDNEKLAKKISDENLNLSKKIKIFIQVNIGDEEQKSGIKKESLKNFYNFCKNLNLDIKGLMCIPPANVEPSKYFEQINLLNKELGLNELSIGMSSDYLVAVKNSATFLRIGSSIFGSRS